MTAQTSSISISLRPLRLFFAKHHAVLFLSCIFLLLALAVYLLYAAIIEANNTVTTNNIETVGKFDQATIDKIKTLHASGDPSDQLTFPSPRSNPFSE